MLLFSISCCSRLICIHVTCWRQLEQPRSNQLVSFFLDVVSPSCFVFHLVFSYFSIAFLLFDSPPALEGKTLLFCLTLFYSKTVGRKTRLIIHPIESNLKSFPKMTIGLDVFSSYFRHFFFFHPFIICLKFFIFKFGTTIGSNDFMTHRV